MCKELTLFFVRRKPYICVIFAGECRAILYSVVFIFMRRETERENTEHCCFVLSTETTCYVLIVTF